MKKINSKLNLIRFTVSSLQESQIKGGHVWTGPRTIVRACVRSVHVECQKAQCTRLCPKPSVDICAK